MSNKNKNRSGLVYSTNPDFSHEAEPRIQAPTLHPSRQNLRIKLDSKMRSGKIVTLIDGFVGTEEDLEQLGKLLKTKCGVGGTAKDKQIMIQGSLKEKVIKILTEEGYKVK